MVDVLDRGVCSCGALWIMTSTEWVGYRKQREEDGAPMMKRNADTMDTEGDGHQSWLCPFCGKEETTDRHGHAPPLTPATDPVLVDPPGRVHTLALCETVFIVLKPDRLYRFEVVPGCGRCERLEAGEMVDITAGLLMVQKQHEALRAAKS